MVDVIQVVWSYETRERLGSDTITDSTKGGDPQLSDWPLLH